MLSLYIHIPFCTQKCAYCSFTSFPDIKEDTINEYIKQLQKEIEHYGKEFEWEHIKTLYFG
ncbi:hypothetical protein KKG31_04905 [Patescibacteria group bacterium]|nr:hypothetical protein [Patescibacteria group bacterium]MBU1758463.1 hypothetical protein [Patescibacteria group bacterium]